MAQEPRISSLTCEAIDDLRAELLAAFADQDITPEEFAALMEGVDEVETLADDTDMAVAVSVATVRRGVKSERRRRLIAEVTTIAA